MSLPVDVLVAIAYGLLAGTVAAAAVGLLAAGSRYYVGRRFSDTGAIGCGLLIVLPITHQFGILTPTQEGALSGGIVATVTVLVVVYAAGQGDRLASAVPSTGATTRRREPTLSSNALESVDALGQIAIAADRVEGIDGYPPLEPSTRRTLERTTWRVPIDLPLPALEDRIADRLVTRHGFETVDVTVDARGRATIAVAPRPTGVAGRLDPGERAVTIDALIPEELARGDRITIGLENGRVEGYVLDVPASTGDHRSPSRSANQGRRPVTVAVATGEAGAVLASSTPPVAVQSAGTDGSFELVTVLERAGWTIRRLPVTESARRRIEHSDRFRVVATRTGASSEESDGGWITHLGRPALWDARTAFVAGPVEAVRTLESLVDIETRDATGIAGERATLEGQRHADLPDCRRSPVGESREPVPDDPGCDDDADGHSSDEKPAQRTPVAGEWGRSS